MESKKEKMCEISVVIPVYNKEKYLKDTVRSVSKQTFGDFELLLIDDGSTDRSGRICDELAATDSRIKVFHTENRGVSSARNFGIRKAEGKYISFVDADDIIAKTFLEKLRNSMVKERAELAVCGYYEIKNDIRIDHDLIESGTGDEIYETIRNNLLCILWNKLYVKEKIRHLFNEKTSTCEDSLFCAQYYYDNHPKITYVNETLYGYLRRIDGLTGFVREQALYGVETYFTYSIRISKLIRNQQLQRLAIHHSCRVYFYAICLFIFENVCRQPMNKGNLSIIAKIIDDDKYRHIIKQVLRYSIYDKKAERTSIKEMLYIIFSLMRMKRAIYILAKVKKCIEPYKIRLLV